VSSHLLDGVPLPDRVSGRIGLELCNTRAGWGSPAPREYLTGDRALVLWAVDCGLLPGGVSLARGVRSDAGPATRSALRLREALYACALRRGTAPAWEIVSRAAAKAHAHATLQPAPFPSDGPAGWRLLDSGDPAERAVDAAALAMERLLTSPDAATVAACPGRACGWLFNDPRGRRRWCSMAVCGNRAKARRHASLRAAARAAPTRTSNPPAAQ
jgi:predicted RNA-binding Zn ribbon-like protein